MIDMIPNIEPWAELWAGSLRRASWQGGIALSIAWAIAHWCTFLSPRVVCWVWRLACIKVLVALVWIEPISLALLPARLTAGSAQVAQVATPEVSSAHTSPPIKNISRVASSSEQLHPALGIPSLLMFAWLLGTGYFLLASCRQWNSARRLVASASARPSARLQLWFRQEADRFRIRRAPRLGISQQIDGPLLAGIWRKVVVLPCSADADFDECELRLMLAHELAHFKRRDLAWNWLPAVVSWLLWFHPLVWVLGRRWSDSQEAACDEMLIQSRAARPADYGRLLVKVATAWPCERRATLAVAGVLGTYRNLERRILTMSRIRPFSAVRVAFLAAIVAIVALPGMIPWQLVAQEPDQNALDHKAIQGTWIVTSLDGLNMNYEPSEQDQAALRSAQFKVVIAEDTIAFWDNGSHWNYTLDATTLPKRMEIRIKQNGRETVAPAIYDLQGDELRICPGRSGDQAPPTDFDVKKTKSGACWNLRRDTGSDTPTGSLVVAQADPKQAAEADAKAREEAFNRLKHFGIAMHNYHDQEKRFPAPAIVDEKGTRLLSWRVMLLPYLEEAEGGKLYKQFRVDEPWDSAHNKALIAKMPSIYRCPKSKSPAGTTVYLAAAGDSTVFPRSEVVNFRRVTDGLSNTIAIVEVDDDHAVPWTKPEDWNFNPQYPNVGLGGHFEDRFLCLFCDGSAHAIPVAMDKEALRALFTRNGGEVLPNPLHD